MPLLRLPRLAPFLVVSIVVVCPWSSRADDVSFDPAQIEFFETRIRPLLQDRCYSCHSGKAKKLQAGLRLDSREALLTGGDSGPAVVPGKPDASLIIQAVKYQSYEMPPDAKLKDSAIADLVRWVQDGVAWPAGKANGASGDAKKDWDWTTVRDKHWAWQPVTKPETPPVRDSAWTKNDIDQFVLARLEAAGLKPARLANPRVLVRRIYLDLIGLPPTHEQVAAFLVIAEQNPQQAVVSLVDDLLESPHYGERWGRHWLDVARYSDGFGGFLDNAGMPQAWRYRDWVVEAFNRDLPYNEFVRLQIAGDLIGKSPEDGVATGFFALGPSYRSDGGDPDSVAQAKSETLDDRLDTLGRGFMALTIACARCHDHKFDPIPQLDYYSLAGVFNNSGTREHPIASPEVVQAYNERQGAIGSLAGRIKGLQDRAKKEKRAVTDNEKKQLDEWNRELTELRKDAPPKYPWAHGLRDTGAGNMKLAIRGNLRKPGSEAPRRFLRLIAGSDPVSFTKGSGRIELADAVASPSNPLTSRVIVNRVWLNHFGKALVRSPGNFGTLGQEPTHPELLDWLAATFIESGWSIKKLHTLILTSATYQMSSRHDEKNFAADGDNRLVWRMNPRRMDVECWRDSLLAVTGELDRAVGGPPIDNIAGSTRRTLYAKVSRNGDRFASDEFLRLFDFPLMRATIAKRPTSIVPQQFLFLMNSSFMVDRAKALTKRLETVSKNDSDRIAAAYRLLFSRNVTKREQAAGLAFLANDPVEDPAQKKETKPSPDADLLIADFEGNSYGDWKSDGEAFGPHPAHGTLPRQMVVSGFLGRGLVNTYFNGDGTIGTLTSPGIRIERPFIRFLIGGGGYPGLTCMNLKVDGKVVRTAVGPNTRGGGSEKLAWAVWDVREFAGKNAVFEIVDNHRAGWGHINIDHIFQSKRADGPIPGAGTTALPASQLARWVQYAQVLLSSNEFMFVR